jgi:hypothetical protein
MVYSYTLVTLCAYSHVAWSVALSGSDAEAQVLEYLACVNGLRGVTWVPKRGGS